MRHDRLPSECKVRDVGPVPCWAPVRQAFIFALNLKTGGRIANASGRGAREEEKSKCKQKYAWPCSAKPHLPLDCFHTLDHQPTPLPHSPTTSIYLVDSTSKCDPSPLSPTEGHTLLSHLCLVSSRQDLKEEKTPSGLANSPCLPLCLLSLCREERKCGGQKAS